MPRFRDTLFLDEISDSDISLSGLALDGAADCFGYSRIGLGPGGQGCYGVFNVPDINCSGIHGIVIYGSYIGHLKLSSSLVL